MKQLLCLCFALFIVLDFQVKGQNYSITETINSGLFYLSGNAQTSSTVLHEVVIVAIDSCDYNTSMLPVWFTQNYTKVHDFFYAATFGNFNYSRASAK